MEEEFLETAVEAARLAGDVLESWSKRFSVREKSPANLVTEADCASQDAIYNHIRRRFPEHNFLGEEGLSETTGKSRYCWVIDPLDGTSNYVHGFPYYAVSIALEHEAELVLGVIFDPNRDEMFTAVRNQGAQMNGDPITTTDVSDLRNAMVVASLPVNVRPEHPAVRQFLQVMPHVQTVQRTGSAALNLAYVGCGRIDAYWSQSLQPWDMAAGAVIVREATGIVSRMNGDPLEIRIPDLLSSNGALIHERLQQLLS
jgi:myo-inositol-1(or 4)-monophosphatase